MPTSTRPQTFENHVQRVPPGFSLTALFGLINLIWRGYRLVREPSIDTAVAVLAAAALLMVVFYARNFAVRAQDRIIRLEMRLRLANVLPSDLRGRIGDLSPGQLIALRFASDDELPELTRRVLADGITDRTAIKKMITNWQADWFRL